MRIASLHMGLAALALLVGPARADLQLCNRASYVVEAAIGIEDKGSAATRGWFRLDPGQCRPVMQGKIEAERVYVHARAMPVYGALPAAQAGHADLCIAEGTFLVAGARHCTKPEQRLVRFTEVKPTESEQGLTASLSEEDDYTTALAQFLKDRGLPSDAARAPAFFDILMHSVKQGEGIGFAWCNETSHTVMAAFGIDDKGAVVTRGWYRIEAGKCLKPDVSGKPRRLYSFAEAVDANGQVIKRADKPLAWGGATTLCTRNVKFELSEHKDCVAGGLTATGFAAIDLTGRAGATVRFRE